MQNDKLACVVVSRIVVVHVDLRPVCSKVFGELIDDRCLGPIVRTTWEVTK